MATTQPQQTSPTDQATPQPVVHVPESLVIPRQPLTPEEHRKAIGRVPDPKQAAQRVQLGARLLRAAEQHVTSQQRAIEQLRSEQVQFQHKLEEDLSRSLQGYDQWLARLESRFGQAMQQFEDRLSAVEQDWAQWRSWLDELASLVEAMGVKAARPTPPEAASPPPQANKAA